MGVQRQQKRGAFLHDAHPCMPVPVDGSLGPFGLPKPTLQIHVVLEAWQRVSTDEEACGKAGHHPCHVVVKRGGKACALLLQVPELGLPLRGGTVCMCQRGRDTLDLLQVLTDDLVFRLHFGHAAVDTGGQALESGVRAAATVGIQVTWERSTDVSQGLRHA
jgi:hypothetical protein